jgi:hypothetical protein
MLFVELAEGTLFGELAKVTHDWLWRNDMTGSRLELGLGCLNKFVVETRSKMENIAGGGESNAWYGSPLLMHIVAEAAWRRAPSSF